MTIVAASNVNLGLGNGCLPKYVLIIFFRSVFIYTKVKSNLTLKVCETPFVIDEFTSLYTHTHSFLYTRLSMILYFRH